MSLEQNETKIMIIFSAVVLLMPIWLIPFGAAYPDLLQKFAIFGIFAIGFNILFASQGISLLVMQLSWELGPTLLYGHLSCLQ